MDIVEILWLQRACGVCIDSIMQADITQVEHATEYCGESEKPALGALGRHAISLTARADSDVFGRRCFAKWPNTD